MVKWLILLIIIGVLALALFAIRVLLPHLKKRGVDVDAVLKQSQSIVATLQNTLEIVKPFLGGIPGIDIIDRILKAAETGVGNAEQLYKVGQLPADGRNNEAKTYAFDTLRLIGIDITPEVERLVSGAIESKVLALGHKQTEETPA
jgi:hypothetical protein